MRSDTRGNHFKIDNDTGGDSMKRWINVLAAVTALLAGTVAQAQTTLKLGYSLATTSHYGVGASVFASEVERRGNGRLKVQEFPASALGGEREMIEAVQLGTLDLVITSTGPMGNFVPET